MKKIAIIALVLTGFTVKAQHDVSLDVLGFAFSKYGLGYEYAINSNNSVGINVNFADKNMLTDNKTIDGDMDYSELNIIPEYKYFMTPNKGNDGIYIGIYGKYRSSSSNGNSFYGADPDPLNLTGISFQQTDVSSTGLSLGAMAGYKWKTSGALFLEVTGGIGKFIMSDITYSNPVAEADVLDTFDEEVYTPYLGNALAVDLRLAVKIGIRFGGSSKE